MSIARTATGQEGAILIDANGAVVLGSGGGPPVTSVWSAADAVANAMTLSNGGLTVTPSGYAASFQTIRTSIGKTSGKLYIELSTSAMSPNPFLGPGLVDASYNAVNQGFGDGPISFGVDVINAGVFVSGGGFTVTGTFVTLATLNVGDILSIAVDFTAQKVWLGYNNTWNGSPSAGTGQIATFTTTAPLFAAMMFANVNEGVWTLQPTAASQKYLPPPGFQAWDGGPVTPLASSVWSSADAAANAMTLSNGGMTVVNTVGVWQSIRGTISRTAGKYYVEFLCANSPTTPDTGFGIADATFAASSYLGSSNYSCGWSNSGGVGLVSPSGFTIIGGSGIHQAVLNDVMQLAIDLTSGKFWYGINNVWGGSGNPATGANPNITISAPALGLAFFPAMSTDNPTAGLWTLQPTAASQKYLPPPGFQAWDGGPVTPSTSVWSAADAAANGMTLSNGGLTVTHSGAAAWGTIRSSISKTSGKLYVEWLVSSASPDNEQLFGLANAAFAIGSYLGSSSYSAGASNAGQYANPGGTVNYTSNLAAPAQNDVYMMAVDFSVGNVWLGRNNVWSNSSNPVTGALPWASLNMVTAGPLFVALSLYDPGSGVWTLQPTAASQKYAPPSGFTPWG